VLSGVITGVTTIAVAFIGMFPQLRNQDKATIDELKADNARLQSENDELRKAQAATWTFTGNIHSLNRKPTGNQQDDNPEVYLISEALRSETDSAGDYDIRNVRPDDYSLLALFPSGKKFKIQVDKTAKTFDTGDGFEISYAREDSR
jgi:hypothetical protein